MTLDEWISALQDLVSQENPWTKKPIKGFELSESCDGGIILKFEPISDL